jgi:hypothetical protein
VNEAVLLGVIEAAAQLAADIEQVPDGKSFFARQHGSDAVALDVLHGGAELAVDFRSAGYAGDVRAAQNLDAFHFFEQRFLQCRGAIAESA